VYGEVGWYRYIYQFFGVGNRYPNTFTEDYTAQYPRLRATAVRNIRGAHFAGLRYFFDDYGIRTTEPGGLIAQNTLTGASGGRTASLGGVWYFDSRDNQFFPGKGWLAEGAFTLERPFTGSQFQFQRLTFEAVRYFSLGKKHRLAVNLAGAFTSVGAPFFNLPQLGGTRRLRGYPDGKFRDRHLLMGQAEWRFPIWWRLKGVVFGGTGTVFGTPGEVMRWRPNAGGGLRLEFDKKQQLHLRVDYGIGESGNSGAYITIGEAF
jgi:outer membrane protein assembly factor BamA